MSHSTRIYPAKLLLFGEHLLLRGATALAVPVPTFFGQWVQKDPDNAPLQWQQLHALLPRLAASDLLDLPRLTADVAAGWYFPSNIPQGYGLGSSGALCAGLFDRYGLVATPAALPLLKLRLAALESTFHGQSSGIDPLTSFVNRPLLIENQTFVKEVAPQEWPSGQPPTVFLLDTRQPRQTGPLVQWFLQQSEQEPLAAVLQQQMLPAHEALVQAWLTADEAAFWAQLRHISALQWEHFVPMLPADSAIRALWEMGVAESGETQLKICGAGGGGFVLGFTSAPQNVEEWAAAHGVPVLFPFRA